MKRAIRYVWWLGLVYGSHHVSAQVDTTFLYSNSKPYGSLDIRIAKSANWYYYLQEDKTFSFRESAPGVKSNTYLDMTSWDSSPYEEGHLREKNGAADNYVMNYRLLMPENYDNGYGPGYPIIIIFHGLGERGNCWDSKCYHADHSYSPVANNPPAPTSAGLELLNNDHQLTNGGFSHLVARNAAEGKFPDDASLKSRAFPGFVLVPQNLNGWDITSTQDAIRLLRLIIKKYNIDPNRVYIHGLSNGGQGVFEAIKRAPWMFAAALTMSAISDANIINQKVATYISPIPLWMFQGGQDVSPSPTKTENYIRQFRDAGVEVRYTKYHNLGHGTWNSAYSEPDFFSWILGRNRADIHPFAGDTVICGTAGLRLEMPEGFFAYQWQYNGQTIPNENQSFFVATDPGSYTGRFSRVANPSEAQWNDWSEPLEVTVGQPLPQAQIEQIGTVLLRDLNNFTDARLKAAGSFSHYFWYKNGALIDFPGEQDDTLQSITIPPTMGNGVYTLATANPGNCISPQSEGKHIFFNNQAPVNLTSPTNLAGEVDGPQIELTWTDASNGEGGFEIWRRRKLDGTTFDKWEMATLTGANATSFKDTRLYPLSVYQYKIRAVSSTGRSEYHPTGTGVELTSGEDTEPPTAPHDLLAERVGVQKVRLIWHRSTDNTLLRDYVVHYGSEGFATGSTDTTIVLQNLPLNAVLDISVTARDIAGNISEASNIKKVGTYMSGLFYEHNTGFVTDLDSIAWGNPEFVGMALTFSTAQKMQEDYFNFRFDGFLYITQPGSYQFRTRSDDGSRLRLNNRLIVENDGIHGLVTKTSGNQSLAKGAQRITVDFFDYIDTDSLAVEYKGPDTNNEWSAMSVEVLKSDPSIVTGIGDDDGPEDSFKLSVYPNPSTQHDIHVLIESVLRSPVQVQLLDAVGRQLLIEVYDANVLSEGVRLAPRATLSEGIYFVIATQEKSKARQRVIVGQ